MAGVAIEPLLCRSPCAAVPVRKTRKDRPDETDPPVILMAALRRFAPQGKLRGPEDLLFPLSRRTATRGPSIPLVFRGGRLLRFALDLAGLRQLGL